MSVTLAPPSAGAAISLDLAGLPTYWSQEQAYATCQAVRETLAAAKATPLSPLQLPYSHRWRKHTHEWIKAAPTA